MAWDVRRWLRDPVVLLCLTAGLLAFVVQSGELGTADTMHRLQTTHWLWTSQPQVFPNEYPEFGIHGRGGQLYSWYGIGQSLLMLPFDVIGTGIAKFPIFSDYTDDPAVRSIVVSYGTSILVNVLTALIALRLLQQLGFTLKESILGVLALMFCTTHLHYTQNMMENNYIMLLTLVGFSFQLEWLQTGRRRALLIGSAALGLNLLTRLTTGLDLIVASFFILLTLWFERSAERQSVARAGAPFLPRALRQMREFQSRFLAYCKIAAPVYLFFLLIDRLYQFLRFGSFTNTYLSLFAKEQRANDPALPANFPWSTPFHEGFLGPLFKPEKSIFLFDPLLILAIVLLVLLWKRLAAQVRAYGVTSLLLLLGYICFYARYTYWAGDFAWGDRYVSTAVEFVAFLAVPLLVRFHSLAARANDPQRLKPTALNASIGTVEAVPYPKSPCRAGYAKWIWRTGVALVCISLVIQIASLMFWLPLEIYQMETLGHPTFVIALRFKNIAAFALGKMHAWGLNNEPMTQDAWDYVHITTWNFLPFLLRRVGAAPAWVVRTAFVVWGMALAVLAMCLEKLRTLAEILSDREGALFHGH